MFDKIVIPRQFHHQHKWDKLLSKCPHPGVGFYIIGNKKALSARMRTDWEKVDLLPPVGRMAVDVMKVEISSADRAFMLMFVKACAVFASLHGLYLLNEVYLAASHQKADGKINTTWQLPFVLFLFCCIATTVWILESENGEGDGAPRAACPDFSTRGAETGNQGVQPGAVHGISQREKHVRGDSAQVDFAQAGKSRLEVQVILNF
ncbi:52 KD protein [Human adenovirus 12]|nr:52 KD protein [Human adenovirus 12]UNB11243.1 52 KD protein [Human adenovirus 12]WEG77431.1 52 KD protein [Human adenovirus 12]WEG78392.1 52 KD protein [Human adenovirus 12]WEG78639.1 52 KD protein [Human adenovirus 12]